MYSHLEQRFRDQIESINNLMRSDDSFSELCADYENVCNSLVVTTMKSCNMTKDFDLLTELIKELEKEILNSLKREKQ